MRKCPNCHQKNIPIFNKTFLTNTKAVTCDHCNKAYGINIKALYIMTLLFVVIIAVTFIALIPINQNLLLFLAILVGTFIIFTLIQLLIIPYEEKSEHRI
ncbi:MAG: hypothetical protein KKH01_01520 [Firmicutes bacterium]|nr:hypothetical protein [Bacillota bacterium]